MMMETISRGAAIPIKRVIVSKTGLEAVDIYFIHSGDPYRLESSTTPTKPCEHRLKFTRINRLARGWITSHQSVAGH